MTRRRAYGLGRVVEVTKRNGEKCYQIQWTDASGKRRRKLAGKNRKDAERLLIEAVRTRELEMAGIGSEAKQDRPVGGLLKSYLADLESHASESHVARSKIAIEAVLHSLGCSTVKGIQLDAVLQYRRTRQRTGTANATINKDVGCLRAMLNWAVRCGQIAWSPLQALSPLPGGKAHQKYFRRALSEDEVKRLIRASRLDDQATSNHQAAIRSIRGGTRGPGYANKPRALRIPQTPMWIAFLETGARWTELTSLCWIDIDFKSRVVKLRAKTTKSKKERLLPVRQALCDELVRLRELQHRVIHRMPHAGDRVFLSPTGVEWLPNRRGGLVILRRLLLAAGIPELDDSGCKVDIHALRHTFATRLARFGVPLQKTQKAMGHSDPKLTADIYAHLDVDDLRDGIEELPSLEPQDVQLSPPLSATGTEIGDANTMAAICHHPSGGHEDSKASTITTSLGPESWSGARGENRTRNPCFTKAVLYH